MLHQIIVNSFFKHELISRKYQQSEHLCLQTWYDSRFAGCYRWHFTRRSIIKCFLAKVLVATVARVLNDYCRVLALCYSTSYFYRCQVLALCYSTSYFYRFFYIQVKLDLMCGFSLTGLKQARGWHWQGTGKKGMVIEITFLQTYYQMIQL